jgi:hypothetical protein
MGDPNILASEKCAIIGVLGPKTVTTVEYTDVIDMSKFHQALGIFLCGNMADANDVVCAAYRCDSGGTNQGAIKTVTRTAGAANDNKQVVIGVRGEDLLPQATYNRYIRFGITNTGGGVCGIVALAIDAKYGPAVDNDLSTVTVIENDLD